MIGLADRKRLVDTDDTSFSIQQQCRLLGIARSSFYYQPAQLPANVLKTLRTMDEMYLEDPTRGTRRYSADLKLLGYHLGRDKVRTYMRLLRVKAVYCMPRTSLSDPAAYKYPYLLRGLQILTRQQVWALDISYIPMETGYMYLLAIMDLYSRHIVGWSVCNSMEAEWVVSTLKEAVEQHGAPGIINSDQGSQFTSEAYVSYVKGLQDVKISMDAGPPGGAGRATDNAFIERFFRTIKYDKLYLEPSTDGVDLWLKCDSFINYYNHRRSHSQIGKLPPAWLFMPPIEESSEKSAN